MSDPVSPSPGHGEIRTSVDPAGDCGVSTPSTPVRGAGRRRRALRLLLADLPPYAIWGVEMDSPRGRIWLMKAGLEGVVEMDGTLRPALRPVPGLHGVRDGLPLRRAAPGPHRVHARADRAECCPRHGRPGVPHADLLPVSLPRRLGVAGLLGWLYQRLGAARLLRRVGVFDRLPGQVRALESLLPDIAPRELRRVLPERLPAVGSPRRRVGLLTGCV